MKRFKCGQCSFESDDIDEIRDHLDTEHEVGSTVNPYIDRGAPGLEGTPIRIYRFTPGMRRLRDVITDEMTEKEEERGFSIDEKHQWLTLTELQQALSGVPTKSVLATWDAGQRRNLFTDLADRKRE